MSFTDWKDKVLFKIFAPSTLCYRGLGIEQYEFKFWAGLPVGLIFKNEPFDKDGYCETVYINNKRVKWWYIIPRHALIEVRRKPKLVTSIIVGTAVVAASLSAIGISTAIIVGVAAIGLAAAGFAMTRMMKKSGGTTNGQNMPTYSSKDNPDLSGAKNEILDGVVPIAFGRCLQTFNFAQFCYPLVKSGYSGNRYRTYFIAGYKNARYEDFRLGDISLSSYRNAAYSLQQANGQSSFIGWDNAFNYSYEKELLFDEGQTVYESATVYYSMPAYSATSFTLHQKYLFVGVDYSHWTNKIFNINSTVVIDGVDVVLTKQITVTKSDLVLESSIDNSYSATKNIAFSSSDVGGAISEYRYTNTSPEGETRGNSYENNLTCSLYSEELEFPDQPPFSNIVEEGVDCYKGDRNEIISQSVHDCKYCDIHFSFPRGLYSISNSGSRVRVKISAEVLWKRKDDTNWSDLSDSNIERIYTRNIDGNIEDLSSRITRSGNKFTFKTPNDINDADDNFYECVGLQFKDPAQYQIKILPVAFKKTDRWVGQIYAHTVIWRLKEDINVVNPDMLPNVSQIACTFNATTQLDGEIDKLCAICRPYIKNIKTGEQEQSRNPVDIIYYLLTDTTSNPNPMSEDQIDMDSFLKARKWCEDHNCKCDGIVTDEVKYETIINEIASNNQLYFIPNKWGRAVLRVDTNEDGRPIKTLFNADNSWDLQIIRTRGKYGRTLAIRASYVDEEIWDKKEITGYWYNGECHWQPETGKDDTYYQPEKRDLDYIKNENDVKRRIAYELEILNEKNTTAKFKVAREVLDLEVLDRVLVADYTRINDGISGTIEGLLYNSNKTKVIGVRTSVPFNVTENMTITIRSVDTSGQGLNVNTYYLKASEIKTSNVEFQTAINVEDCIIRGSGFYTVDGVEFYHSGDLYMAGTAEILDMVISDIDEVDGEQFTSSITCRLF